MTLRDDIRSWVLIQGKSQRAAARHFGLSRNTVAKLLVEGMHQNWEHRYQSGMLRQFSPRPVWTLRSQNERCEGIQTLTEEVTLLG